MGNRLGVQPGESLRTAGRWATDKKYGEPFRVESYVTVKGRHAGTSFTRPEPNAAGARP